MFAAAFNRADAVKLLLARGADHKATTKVVDLFALTAPEEEAMLRGAGGNSTRPQAPARVDIAGATRGYRYNELISSQGGMTALQFAARQGFTDVVKALVEGGADINQLNAGDKTSPLLITIINGHFDLAMYLLDKGANANACGVQRRRAALRRAQHSVGAEVAVPQSQGLSAADHDVSAVDDGVARQGRRPERARAAGRSGTRPTTPTTPGFDEAGATPFFRAAYASDVAAMKLLVSRGADANIPDLQAGRPAVYR